MTDWSRITRAVYRVRHHYRYSYTGPVWDMKQRLIMIPRDRVGDQRVLDRSLAVRGVEGDMQLTWTNDEFGNRVANVVAPRVPVAVDFEAVFQVERDTTSSNGRRPAPWAADPQLVFEDALIAARLGRDHDQSLLDVPHRGGVRVAVVLPNAIDRAGHA